MSWLVVQIIIVAILGKKTLSRYVAKIPVEFMYVMYYKYVYIYSPNLSDHDFVSHKDYKDFTLLGPARNEIKGNRLVEKSGKVNPAILYRNELGPKKQTITHELYSLKLPRDQIWKNHET